jgi:hypothetical protein
MEESTEGTMGTEGTHEPWTAADQGESVTSVGLPTPFCKKDWGVDDFVINLLANLVTEDVLLEHYLVS